MTDIDQYIVTEPDKTFTVRVPPFMEEGYRSINAARKQVRELLTILKNAEDSETVPVITKKMVEVEVERYADSEDKTMALIILAVSKHFKLINGADYQKMLKTVKSKKLRNSFNNV